MVTESTSCICLLAGSIEGRREEFNQYLSSWVVELKTRQSQPPEPEQMWFQWRITIESFWHRWGKIGGLVRSAPRIEAAADARRVKGREWKVGCRQENHPPLLFPHPPTHTPEAPHIHTCGPYVYAQPHNTLYPVSKTWNMTIFPFF